MTEVESDDIFCKKYEPIIEKKYNVGSEAYNAPELWDNDINQHEIEMKIKASKEKFDDADFTDIDAKLRNMSLNHMYNGEKADIFSCGATLFFI